MTDWTAKLTSKGIRVEPLGPGHWRATKGARRVDYWPNTECWRDLDLGVQGAGVRALLGHFR